jgi:hypothetical protein
MVNPPPGRTAISMSEIDEILDKGTVIKKVSPHPQGDTNV